MKGGEQVWKIKDLLTLEQPRQYRKMDRQRDGKMQIKDEVTLQEKRPGGRKDRHLILLAISTPRQSCKGLHSDGPRKAQWRVQEKEQQMELR